MKDTFNVGIIGRGFVGGAIEQHLLKNNCNVLSYDISDYSLEASQGYNKIVEHSDIIYVCVPTPQKNDGSFCKDILDMSIGLVSFFASAKNKDVLVLIKSTMMPGTADDLQQKYPNISIAVNPEFLTERTAFEDVSNTTKHLIGINDDGKYSLVESFCSKFWKDSQCVRATRLQAEIIKYTTNSFYSVKVAFANNIYELCKTICVDYQETSDKMIEVDPRVGELHWQVPGHDGKFGFGGKCFPKDLNGMISLFTMLDIDCSILNAAKNYNDKIRNNK